MKAKELKELSKIFRKTLGKEPDEWWATEQEIWDKLSKKFVMWYNNYGRKELEKKICAEQGKLRGE